ncbi:MAG: ABC transporter permease [Deltaproteobacteria bacterium]
MHIFRQFSSLPRLSAALLRNSLQAISLPLAAVIAGLLIGAAILIAHGANPMAAYAALWQGSFGSLAAIGRTLEKTTPLVFSGLALAFAFKAGLFNIGAQGQLLFGALGAAVVGFGLKGLPAMIHIPLALLTGAAAGALYAFVQGALKVYTGAHEVITGIMLNYVAINFTDYLAAGPFKDTSPGNIIARTALIRDASQIPRLWGIPTGFLIGLGAALILWWLLKKTTVGFEMRTTGLNVHAAQYAGINVRRLMVMTMVFSGVLAGLGGAVETQGVVHRFQPGFNVGLGFDGITIALLARTHPLGVIPAALLVGAMRAGSNRMQFSAGVSLEIIDVILGLILFLVAADRLLRWMLRRRRPEVHLPALSTGWGRQ